MVVMLKHFSKWFGRSKYKYIRGNHVYDCYKLINPEATFSSMLLELDLQFIVIHNSQVVNWINTNPLIVVKMIQDNPSLYKLYILKQSITKHRELNELIEALWEYR